MRERERGQEGKREEGRGWRVGRGGERETHWETERQEKSEFAREE